MDLATFDRHIGAEAPDDPAERVTQLAFMLGKHTTEVLLDLTINRRAHPAAVLQPVESQIIAPNAQPKMKLVAIVIPVELLDALRKACLEVIAGRDATAAMTADQRPS